MKSQFVSDNTAAIAAEPWQALSDANSDYEMSYGEDTWTARAKHLIQEFFETDCDVYFVFNGTAANALALSALTRSFEATICHEISHVNSDECGAPGFFNSGSKLLAVGGEHGKLDLDQVRQILRDRSDVHFTRPAAVSLAQTTEMATVYSVDELHAVQAIKDESGLKFHMDGARLMYAVAALGVAPKAITWQCGVDALSFGGTKLGLPATEAVVFFNHTLARDFDYRVKQAGQLASKMRFLAAPWVGILADQAWLKHARHANAAAKRLAAELEKLDGANIVAPVQANAVFAAFSPEIEQRLHEKNWEFVRVFIAGSARLMCSWQTTDHDIDELIADIRGGS